MAIVKRGDCVYHAAKSYAVAHAVESVIGGRVRTACGRWYERGVLNHNLSRREPCESCASAIERRAA